MPQTPSLERFGPRKWRGLQGRVLQGLSGGGISYGYELAQAKLQAAG